MNRPGALFGLAALIPALFNAVPALARDGSLLVPLCTGDGEVRMVEVPRGGDAPAPESSSCCVKGCHSGSSRKRMAGRAGPIA